MEKNTKLIIGGIAVAAFVGYMIFRKPKKTGRGSRDGLGGGGGGVVDTLPPVTQEEFNTMPVAYGETKEAACLNKSIPTVTLHMKTAEGITPNKTIFYTDSSYKTPVKSGFYAEKFDLCLYVSEGGLLTEMTTC